MHPSSAQRHPPLCVFLNTRMGTLELTDRLLKSPLCVIAHLQQHREDHTGLIYVWPTALIRQDVRRKSPSGKMGIGVKMKQRENPGDLDQCFSDCRPGNSLMSCEINSLVCNQHRFNWNKVERGQNTAVWERKHMQLLLQYTWPWSHGVTVLLEVTFKKSESHQPSQSESWIKGELCLHYNL